MAGWLHALFSPKHGPALWGYLLGALVFSVLVLALLDRLPARSKRRLIATTTFLAGLYGEKGPGTVAVGRDVRLSSTRFEQSLIAGINPSGGSA